jgi:hypothetical protein
MRSAAEVETVLSLVAMGKSDVDVARRTGVPRSTVRDWRVGRLPGRNGVGARARTCPICQPGSEQLHEPEYAYLLGLYLGDGYVSKHPRTYCLRIFLDAIYPEIVRACHRALEVVRPANRAWIGRSKKCRCNVVMMYSNHWPCLLPQMGPGRKHERPIPRRRRRSGREERALPLLEQVRRHQANLLREPRCSGGPMDTPMRQANCDLPQGVNGETRRVHRTKTLSRLTGARAVDRV